MATVHLLGTGAAFSDAGRTTTMICVTNQASTLLIDCGGDAVSRMQQKGLDTGSLRALFLTHEHIDHVGGFPLLYKKLWLSGRKDPLPVYGIPPALVQAARCFYSYDTRAFTDLPPIAWRAITPDTSEAIFLDEHWEVFAASGEHGVPVTGLRICCRHSGTAVTYSSDTSHSGTITRLAEGSTLLLHEATGLLPGHSSAEQAAQTARDAGVEQLVLVHLPPRFSLSDLHSAKKIFAATETGEELSSYQF